MEREKAVLLVSLILVLNRGTNAFTTVSTTATSPPVDDRCPQGWLPWQENCYFFDTYDYVTWEAAEDICKTLAGNTSSGHLVSIHSQEENDFIFENRYMPSFYIGLMSDGSGNSNDTYWSDGTPLSYTNWYNDETPPPGDEYCAQMYPAPFWSGYHCCCGYLVCKTKMKTPPVWTTVEDTSEEPTATDVDLTTEAPPSEECSDLVGTWRSTSVDSQAMFVITGQEDVDGLLHFEGFYRNRSAGGYYPLYGWAGNGNPCVVVLEVLFEDSMLGIAFSGKCSPSYCGITGTTLNLMATTAVVDSNDYQCSSAKSWNYTESFVKDPEVVVSKDDINDLYQPELVTSLPSDCGDYVGTWRSTAVGSEALFTIYTQETIEDFIYFEGVYQSQANEEYFPIYGRTGVDYPCTVVMQVLWQDCTTGIGFAGKCMPSVCTGTNVILQLTTTTSQIPLGGSACDEAISSSSEEYFMKDFEMMDLCKDEGALEIESVKIFCRG